MSLFATWAGATPHRTMLYFRRDMPVVFVIARDWTLRAGVRAELREYGVDALGMESADDVGRALVADQVPSAVVVEGLAEFAGDAGVHNLVERVPAVLVSSRTETLDLPRAAVVLYRPVTVGEIAARVREILTREARKEGIEN